MFYSRFPTYRVVFMQKLPISHVCLSPVFMHQGAAAHYQKSATSSFLEMVSM